MKDFRRLFPEYNHLDDASLFVKLYTDVGFDALSKFWPSVFSTLSLAIGIPVLVLVMGFATS